MTEDLKITNSGMTIEVMELPKVGFDIMVEGSPEYGHYNCASITLYFDEAKKLRDYLVEKL